ncbi:MAG: hypothetical protein ACP5GX_06845 [Anaerolineae bacterium]
MITKYPIEYELSPTTLEPGRRWLTVRLRNVGETELVSLDVQLNSLDAYALSVYGTGSYVPVLGPGEEQILPFQVSANASGSVYLSLDGWENDRPFHWESPGISVTVGEEVAELVTLFALTEPYPALGEQIRCEAAIQSLKASDDLVLEFWVETPSAEFQGVKTLEIPSLAAGEQARFSTKIMPKEPGLHVVHVYLYEGVKRLGHKTDRVYVQEG